MPEYLDPEIYNEGESAEAAWAPAVEEARVPSYKGIKSIAKYFPQFTGRPYQHQVFPCWLYHETEEPRLIKDKLTGEDPPRLIKRASEIAKELGCVYRQSTREEIADGFPSHRWQYTGEWRAKPFKTGFDPKKPETGKHVIVDKDKASTPAAQADLIAATVAIVLEKMRIGEAASAAGIDADRAEFEVFKTWKAASQQFGKDQSEVKTPRNVLNESEEREIYEEEARTKGIKVDGRWSLERLKQEVEKST